MTGREYRYSPVDHSALHPVDAAGQTDEHVVPPIQLRPPTRHRPAEKASLRASNALLEKTDLAATEAGQNGSPPANETKT